LVDRRPAVVSEGLHEVILESIHMLKVNESEQLTRRSQLPLWLLIFAGDVVRQCARHPQTHEALLRSGVVGALLFATANNSWVLGSDVGSRAAAAAVRLIGTNEEGEGLTLTRAAVDAVCARFSRAWDPTDRSYTYTVAKLHEAASELATVLVSDANKTFVLTNDSAIDSLVSGLLLDTADPRSSQDGAETLQRTCAAALQHLALSPMGLGPLRTHASAMQALRQLASCGMTDEARRCAQGALFELEGNEQRPQTGKTVGIEHIMLSYNWDHQAVIKRVHASLVRRGCTTWIDVEKMQGSTVEAMANAVEGAAAMLYGISRAYKE
jgi:hypothetical protein